MVCCDTSSACNTLRDLAATPLPPAPPAQCDTSNGHKNSYTTSTTVSTSPRWTRYVPRSQAVEPFPPCALSAARWTLHDHSCLRKMLSCLPHHPTKKKHRSRERHHDQLLVLEASAFHQLQLATRHLPD